MAGLSTLRDGNGVNCVENCQNKLRIRVDSVNLESVEEGKDEEHEMQVLRGLFDQVLVAFVRDAKNVFRPIPALIGDGRSIDLFRLFYMVRERGGFHSVSREKLWGLIAENLDFDFRFSASLKLIYFKYFDELDRRLNRMVKDVNKSTSECDSDLELLSFELEKRFRGLSMEDVKVKKIENGEILAGCDMKYLQISGMKKDSELANVANCKRKSEDWQEMLSWLKQVAKKPRDLSNGRMPHSCRWNENGGKESRELALLAREAMLKRKRYPNLKDDEDRFSSDQKKQKIHPTTYNDPSSVHSESVRVSKRVPALVKSPRCSCCGPSSSTKENRLENNCKVPQLKNDPQEHNLEKKTPLPDQPVPKPSEPLDPGRCPEKLPVEKQVNVGPQFQAVIPPWTGKVPHQDCDKDKLGTRIWPPKNREDNILMDIRSVIGKGRPELCDCPFPGSVVCVRFHTAENRLKLQRELGRAFYQWKFDRMGEVVSLSWTQQEEEKFKKVMSTTPLSMGKSSFPKKTRKEFLDYYFNVFLQSKRSYQNRVTPKAVDSDDELSEFGSVGGLYGYAACKAPSSCPLKCTLNEKCLDLDMTMKVKRSELET
ncbi:hypothetical protein V2J09_020228 [Rumex salicifolius]